MIRAFLHSCELDLQTGGCSFSKIVVVDISNSDPIIVGPLNCPVHMWRIEAFSGLAIAQLEDVLR